MNDSISTLDNDGLLESDFNDDTDAGTAPGHSPFAGSAPLPAPGWQVTASPVGPRTVKVPVTMAHTDGGPSYTASIPPDSAAARERYIRDAARWANDAGRPPVDQATLRVRLVALPDEIAAARAAARASADAEARPALRNHDDGEALPLAEIDAQLEQLTDGWPRKVGERLFVEAEDHAPLYLTSPTKLFAWLDGRAQVDWHQGPRHITQERYYESRVRQARAYATIETMPHTPSMEGAYYMHPPLPAPSGKLAELVRFFSPASDVNRSLLLSAIVTPSWGGPPGKRPAYLIVGPDDDGPRKGRGVGKSSLVDQIADGLYGGSISISPTEDIAQVKTRLLSPEAATRRIIRLDNIKTYRFSWADLEDLITATVVSGRALYTGEGRRPNTFTTFITLNGANVSKDIAERVIPIKLARPPEDRAGEPWCDRVARFIAANRWEILADIADLLGRQAREIPRRIRWEDWEQGVLARIGVEHPRQVEGLAPPEACQAEVLERQAAIDADDAECDLVRDHIYEQLRRIKCDPDKHTFKIPSALMASWVSAAKRSHFATNDATGFVKTLSIAELKHIPKVGNFRGWLWTGQNAPPDAISQVLANPDDPETVRMQAERTRRLERRFVSGY